jgi:hypothetical protein
MNEVGIARRMSQPYAPLKACRLLIEQGLDCLKTNVIKTRAMRRKRRK